MSKRTRAELGNEDSAVPPPAIGGPHSPIHKVNPVKHKLQNGGIVVAGTINCPCLETAVVMASAFDALWIEGEHSAITLETTRNIILATRGMKAVPLVRVPWQELWMAKRVMDIGSLGVIFPFCSTIERCKQAASACRYPPLGSRGCGPTMSQLAWGLDESTYYSWANENMLCTIIIEEGKAADIVDEIAALGGIDLIFIGTSDLSFSITGAKTNVQSEPVQEAINKVLAAGKKHGIPVGCPAGSAQAMQELIPRGFQFFQAPPEIGFLQKAVGAFAESIQGLTGSVCEPGAASGAPAEGGSNKLQRKHTCLPEEDQVC